VIDLPDGRPGSLAFNSPSIIRTELNGLLNSVNDDVKLR
jgi:hypothetical protein